jgi:hypothetical protein
VAALGMPATLSGSVLIAPCTRDGTYTDAAGDTTDVAGTTAAPGVRGMLIFQDHGDTTQPVLTGSGSLAFAGALYFHATDYSINLKFSGNGASTTFVIGEIIADQVSFSGNGSVNLALNPEFSVNTSKAAILQ